MFKNINHKLKLHFKIAAVLLLLIQFIDLKLYAQNTEALLNRATGEFNKQSELLPVEKVYIHMDKPYYTAGDKIWFRGYVTIGAKHRLSAKSGLLTVEVLDSRNHIKHSLKLKLVAGMCSGSIALADTLPQGNYTVKAYTNWMRNWGEEHYFQHIIAVGNAINTKVLTKATYSYQQLGTGQQINVNIRYTNFEDSIYANKEVRYSIIKEGKIIDKGRGTTDTAGNLKISYLNSEQSKPGVIQTSIILGKKAIESDIRIKPDTESLNIHFFPEGGYMTNGLSAQIAFKAIGADGLGKNVSGVIVDNENQEVTQFSSQHLGMGAFSLLPASGKTYKAKFKTDEGATIIANLPIAQDKGYALRVFNTDTSKITLSIFGSSLIADTGKLSLIAQSGGIICYKASIKIKGSKPAILNIPQSYFPSGLAQFTLFSSTGEPLNERVTFINHDNNLINMQIQSDKSAYRTRENVTINLTTKDYANKPVLASVSAAVINEGLIGTITGEASILSTLLLTSDLKGYVEQPDYYFTAIDEQTRANLDLLMLTQGYRKFEWKKVLAGDLQKPVYTPENTFKIAGTLTTPGGKPVVKGKVRLLTTTGVPVIIDTLSNDNGRFVFDDMWFKDSTRFVIQANTGKGKSDIVITLDAPPNPKLVNAFFDAAAGDSIPLSYLQNSKKLYQQDLKYGEGDHSIMLKEVVIKETTKPELKHSANLNGPGVASVVISGKELRDRGCTSIANCLNGRLRGVIIGINGIPYSPKNRNSLVSDNANVLVMVDGMAITGAGASNSTGLVDSPLNSVRPEDVASIEYISDPADLAIYGVQGSNGIILINTRRGDEDDYKPIKATNMLSFYPQGYYITREFYSPDYTVADKTMKADLRSTIYWNPEIYTDANGNAKLNYFNADGKGTYRVVIEGIDNNGNLGRQIYRYKVE